MSEHIDRIVTSCASLKFALRTLRSHGLQPTDIHLVARMPPRPGGVLWIAAERSCLERSGLRRGGTSQKIFPRSSDAGPYKSISSNYLTDKKPSGHNQRPRAHGFALPSTTPETLFLILFMEPWLTVEISLMSV